MNRLGKLLSYGIPQNELVDILNNLISNSFEAVEDLDQEKRFVWLDFSENTIEIKNSALFDTEKDMAAQVGRFKEKGYSTKGPDRGYGLSNVYTVAEKYGVKVNSDYVNGLVVFKMEFQAEKATAPEETLSSGAEDG